MYACRVICRPKRRAHRGVCARQSMRGGESASEDGTRGESAREGGTGENLRPAVYARRLNLCGG